MKIPKNMVQLIAELKTPKQRKNSFAKFNYRNVEDITMASKPLLEKHKLLLNISDDLYDVDGRLFVKATATISDGETALSSTGYAELDSSRKGMSMEQISGSASSYARKYALAGLLCLDASEDSDAHQARHTVQTITAAQAKKLEALITQTGSDKDKFLKWLGVDKVEDIPKIDFVKSKTVLESKIQNTIEPLK
nr:essential recombination function protein [uncultured Mediterranean phage uvMED]